MTSSPDDFWAQDPDVIERGGILSPDRLTPLERFNWDIVDEVVGLAFGRLRGTEFASELIGLEIRLIDQPAINAFLRLAGQRKLIGLSRGLIDQLWTLVATLLAHPEVLEEHFKDDLKIDMNAWQRDLDTQLTSLRENLIQPASIPSYITADRLEAATQFYYAMIDHVIHHELAHLLRDHATLLCNRFSLSLVEEVPRGRLSQEIVKTLNFVEIDADLHGLDVLMTYDLEFKELCAPGASVADRRLHMFMRVFPHLLMSQLFDFEHTSLETQLSQHHPPPVYRAIVYSMAMSDTYWLTVGLAKAEAVDEHDKAWWEASRCAKLLGFPEGRWVGHTNDIDFAYVHRLVDDYKEFEEILNITNTL